MGNGGPEILAMADLVTDDVEADGSTRLLRNWFIAIEKTEFLLELSLYFMLVYDR